MQSNKKLSPRPVQIISFAIAILSIIVALVVFFFGGKLFGSNPAIIPPAPTVTIPTVQLSTSQAPTITVTPTPSQTGPIVGATKPPIPSDDLASLQATVEAQNVRITDLENFVATQSKVTITNQQLQSEIDILNAKIDLQNKFIDERLASINTTLSWFVPVILTFALSLLTFVGSSAIRQWTRRDEGK